MDYLAVNTIWVLVGAALVFFMQAGFAMVETGFTRAKNAGNIIMKNLMDSVSVLRHSGWLVSVLCLEQETASLEESAELPPRQITEVQCFLTAFRSGHF